VLVPDAEQQARAPTPCPPRCADATLMLRRRSARRSARDAAAATSRAFSRSYHSCVAHAAHHARLLNPLRKTQVPYAAAATLLLSRVPELPDVLSITRGQTLIFFITLLVAELGVSARLQQPCMHACACPCSAADTAANSTQLRCQRGVRLTLAVRAVSFRRFTLLAEPSPPALPQALHRAEVEHAVHLEIGTPGADGSEPRGCIDARLASTRARRYAAALAATSPLELAGAVLAALAPHPAPGVFAMVAAQACRALHRSWHASAC
jgi:hypothetical protein